MVSTGMWDCNKVFMVDIWVYGYRWLSLVVESLDYKLLFFSILCVVEVLNATTGGCFLVLKLVDSSWFPIWSDGLMMLNSTLHSCLDGWSYDGIIFWAAS